MIVEPQQAEDILQSGRADMVALARGLLDDPRWVWHAAERFGVKCSTGNVGNMLAHVATTPTLSAKNWPTSNPNAMMGFKTGSYVGWYVA